MAARQKKSLITAEDIMTRPVVSVGAQDALAVVEQRLVDAHITGVPVVEDGRLVGIITRSDFVRLPILLKSMDEYVADRRHENGMQQQDRRETKAFRSGLENLKVSDVMTKTVVTCVADTPVSEIAARMVNHHVHRLVVVDGERPIGIVGSLDLVKLMEHGLPGQT
ncbi:MAG TPA: CBS domain-containing protein [Halioglobus sp.]